MNGGDFNSHSDAGLTEAETVLLHVPRHDPKTHFKLSVALGEGEHSSVFKAQHRLKKYWVTLKRIRTSLTDARRPETHAVLAHAAQLRALRHPNLRRYFGAKLRGEDVWLVTAYFERGNLLHTLMLAGEKRLTESLKSVVWQVLQALAFLREAHYAARLVLRARRVYVERDGTVCLDIISVPQRPSAATAAALHRVEWLAPEELSEGRHDERSTVFLLGIFVLELANGRLPPLFSNAARAARSIVHDPAPTLDEPEHWSVELATFVARCLAKEAEQRPDVHALLHDVWLRDASKTPLAALYAQRPAFDAADDDTATTAPSLPDDVTPDTSTPRHAILHDFDDEDEDGNEGVESGDECTKGERLGPSTPTRARSSGIAASSLPPSSSPSLSTWSMSDIVAVAAGGVVTSALLVLAYALVTRARHA